MGLGLLTIGAIRVFCISPRHVFSPDSGTFVASDDIKSEVACRTPTGAPSEPPTPAPLGPRLLGMPLGGAIALIVTLACCSWCCGCCKWCATKACGRRGTKAPGVTAVTPVSGGGDAEDGGSPKTRRAPLQRPAEDKAPPPTDVPGLLARAGLGAYTEARTSFDGVLPEMQVCGG